MTNWYNNKGENFDSKASAFNWLNNCASNEIDTPKLYCNGELRYSLTPFGIFDNHFEVYVIGKLPVEIYS